MLMKIYLLFTPTCVSTLNLPKYKIIPLKSILTIKM